MLVVVLHLQPSLSLALEQRNFGNTLWGALSLLYVVACNLTHSCMKANVCELRVRI